eukprot:2578902-Rhodomonas_salina.1
MLYEREARRHANFGAPFASESFKLATTILKALQSTFGDQTRALSTYDITPIRDPLSISSREVQCRKSTLGDTGLKR